MERAEAQGVPVNAKAVLIDADCTTVLWMNESAAGDSEVPPDSLPAPLGQVVPISELIGVPEALLAVSRTGVAQHTRTDLVSTSRGRVVIAASMYRLPDGRLLLLIENAWQVEHAKSAGGASRGSGRRTP